MVVNYKEKILNIQNTIENSIQEFKNLKDELLSSWSDELSNKEKSNIPRMTIRILTINNLISLFLTFCKYI